MKHDLQKAVGKNIKWLRHCKQLSQADLAEKAHISVIHLSNIERGNHFPQAKTLASIAEALNLEVWEIFKGKYNLDRELLAIDRFYADIAYHFKNAVDLVHTDLTQHINSTIETIHSLYNEK